MSAVPALVLALVVSRGSVVVLGDSNSCMWPRSGCLVGDTFSWAYRMTTRAGWPGWTLVNRALPGMTAGDYGPAEVLANGEPADGGWQLERLVREDLDVPSAAGGPPGPRKLVIALGTNDVARPDVSGVEAGRAVLALYARARRVPGVEVYVATIPPRRGVRRVKIATANATIRAGVRRDHVIPFSRETGHDLNASGVHMTAAGQQHRAALAFRVLFPHGGD